jgi:alkanesulfonate monooxygenase SsuD/methylene tetrahydromethanopterin reductase-like flavin-dependent oxidoreductase (luciferase family)
MRFGIFFFPTLGPEDRPAAEYYDDCLALAERADAANFATLKTVEHYLGAYGGYSPDPVAFLAAASQRTSRIRLVTGAVIPAFHHPLQLASRLAMLDNLCHGRLDAGFGRGFLPQEFAAFGVPMDQSQERFVRGVEAVRSLWTGEEVVLRETSHPGGPMYALPRPVQVPHPPIWVAVTRTPGSFIWAGHHGYFLMTVPHVATRQETQNLFRSYRQAWCRAGHEPGSERIQISYQCLVSEDGKTARALTRGHFEDYGHKLADAVALWAHTRSTDYPGYERLAIALAANTFDRALANATVLVGNPEEVVSQLQQVRRWYGDVELSLQVNFGTLPLEVASHTLDLLVSEVIPRLGQAQDR